MRKTLRTALIWMLMLALPAQAMAALGMQLCELVHRSGALQISGSEHGGHHDMTADSAHGAHQDPARWPAARFLPMTASVPCAPSVSGARLPAKRF